MVHIEAVKLAVGGQIDAGALLGGNDDGCGVENGLLAGQRGEPVISGVDGMVWFFMVFWGGFLEVVVKPARLAWRNA
ncbi:MAG: hypothetical protein NTZ08_04520 [Verrucomicrobia bacterium]|nr:hypothetical protein [Verrucomicrobiota bacterium]